MLPSNFPSLIRSLRVRLGLSQRDLAKLLGITPGSICNWEKGVSTPSDSRWAIIAKELGVPIDYFLEDSPEKPLGIIQAKDHATALKKSDLKAIEELTDRIIRIFEVSPKLAKKVISLVEEMENSMHPANPAFRAVQTRARRKSPGSKTQAAILAGARPLR